MLSVGSTRDLGLISACEGGDDSSRCGLRSCEQCEQGAGGAAMVQHPPASYSAIFAPSAAASSAPISASFARFFSHLAWFFRISPMATSIAPFASWFASISSTTFTSAALLAPPPPPALPSARGLRGFGAFVSMPCSSFHAASAASYSALPASAFASHGAFSSSLNAFHMPPTILAMSPSPADGLDSLTLCRGSHTT